MDGRFPPAILSSKLTIHLRFKERSAVSPRILEKRKKKATTHTHLFSLAEQIEAGEWARRSENGKQGDTF